MKHRIRSNTVEQHVLLNVTVTLLVGQLYSFDGTVMLVDGS